MTACPFLDLSRSPVLDLAYHIGGSEEQNSSCAVTCVPATGTWKDFIMKTSVAKWPTCCEVRSHLHHVVEATIYGVSFSAAVRWRGKRDDSGETGGVRKQNKSHLWLGVACEVGPLWTLWFNLQFFNSSGNQTSCLHGSKSTWGERGKKKWNMSEICSNLTSVWVKILERENCKHLNWPVKLTLY